MTRVELLGLPLDVLDVRSTLDQIEDFVNSRAPHQHVVVNAAKIVQAQRSPDLAEVIRSCDLINADGMAVVWAGRLLGVPVPERVAGIDLMDDVLARAAVKGWRVYFLGARQEVVEEVARRETARHPGLTVAGFRNGYWTPLEEAGVVRAVAEARPDILLVAMPSPQKEHFLGRHKETLAVPFVMGVGGSFDVVAGKVNRAPRWMQRAGLEWLFRMLQEPRRMFTRYLVGNTRFVMLVLRHWRATR
jgi:N-acetylglucosaminyldiphosphoundecaprenol N-acetyl-beta-D-mannosaminyltransferase